MKTLIVADEEYRRFLLDNGYVPLSSGSEANLHHNYIDVIKKYRSKSKMAMGIRTKKIRLLSSIPNKNMWITPHSLIYNTKHQFRACMMEYFDGKTMYDTNFNDFNLSVKLLLKLKEALLEMHRNNIISGDIYYLNIIINENDPLNCRYIDMENSQIDGIKPLIYNYRLYPYLIKSRRLSINSDIFMFNQLSYWFLMEKRYSNQHRIMDAYEEDYYPGRGEEIYKFTKEYPSIFRLCRNLSQTKLDCDCDHDFLIDHIVDKQKQFVLK